MRRQLINVASLVFGDGLTGWRRGLRTAAPAIGTLCVVLLLAGAGSLVVAAARQSLAAELRQATVVRVYLKQDVTDDEAAALRDQLRSDPRVASVRSVSAAEALAQAVRRPGLLRLADAAGDNPFPARLEVRAVGLADVAAIVGDVSGDPAVDPATPTSYDPGAYAGLQRFLRIGGIVALAVGGVLALVGLVVTANAARASLLARREDLAVMRLLGARGLVLGGPFVVEGALTGVVAGLLAGLVLAGLFAGASAPAARSVIELLPGVGWRDAAMGAALLPAAGLVLGSLGALRGLRRVGR